MLPPRGRRRPVKVRSNSDLRDAVAEAVARAAAQGPLVPRAPEDEPADMYEELARLATEEVLAESSRSEEGDGATAPADEGTVGELDLSKTSVRSDRLVVEAASLQWENEVRQAEGSEGATTEVTAVQAAVEVSVASYREPQSARLEEPDETPLSVREPDGPMSFSLDEPVTEGEGAHEPGSEAAALAQAAIAAEDALVAQDADQLGAPGTGEVPEETLAAAEAIVTEALAGPGHAASS